MCYLRKTLIHIFIRNKLLWKKIKNVVIICLGVAKIHERKREEGRLKKENESIII